MEERAIRHFYYEIQLQSKFCLWAYDGIKKNTFGDTGNHYVLYHLQGFLVSCANISKILFPVDWSSDNKKMKERKKERGYELRKNLEVNDDYVLKDRKFRDHFEHYDERIEEWYENNKGDVFYDLWVGDLDRLRRGFPQFNEKGVHRHFDPKTEIARFRDSTYDLKPMVAEIKRLSEITTRLLGE